MPTKFKIEATLQVKKSGSFVFAKLLDKHGSFTLNKDSKLGAVEIFPRTQIPRKLDAEGNIRMDIYGFQLKTIVTSTS